MKKKLILIFTFIIMILCLTGCGASQTKEKTEQQEDVDLGYVASFYSNDGTKWFETTGRKLDIKANKVKEYGYSSDGTWTSFYETSSIVSIFIDEKQIDTCGSTVLFADNKLEECDIDFTGITNTGSSASINSDNNLNIKDYLTIQYWWYDKQLHGQNTGQKLIVVQSQNGNPITMYMGKDVSWSMGDLPKTTLVKIDGKQLYIHRANFAIIDTDLIKIEEPKE